MSAHSIPVQGEGPNARVTGLSAAKRALLELRLKKSGKVTCEEAIPEQAAADFRQVGLSAVPAAAHAEEMQRLLTEEARRPFDLARDVMFRGLLLKLAPGEHVLYLGTHHIASDGWSKSVLFKEMK